MTLSDPYKKELERWQEERDDLTLRLANKGLEAVQLTKVNKQLTRRIEVLEEAFAKVCAENQMKGIKIAELLTI
jgi:hypothetical protein